MVLGMGLAERLFPLTPALSLRGREPRNQSVGHVRRTRHADALPRVLPLPEGEGGGEGEGDERMFQSVRVKRGARAWPVGL
jgi:hypothetical protein